MTNAETIGQPVLEQKRCEQELKALHLKAGQHAAKFAMLAQLLRDDPRAIAFDEQSTRRSSDSVAHFESTESSGLEIKELVGQIRDHEDRLSDLRKKLE
jgi:hypothetical protein